MKTKKFEKVVEWHWLEDDEGFYHFMLSILGLSMFTSGYFKIMFALIMPIAFLILVFLIWRFPKRKVYWREING